MDVLPRSVAMRSANRVKEKYSGGPNFKTNSAEGAAMKGSPMIPMIPAINDPMAAMPRAGPGSFDLSKLDELLERFAITLWGLSRNPDGEQGDHSSRLRKFKESLDGHFGLRSPNADPAYPQT